MLEVYEPDSESDIICSYTADTVFPTISKGDILTFPSISLNDEIQATKIVHLIWDNEKYTSFKTMIFTKKLVRD